MKQYKYLIIGSGMTADAAARGIREIDDNGSIGMISAETEMPYARPPLTKGMWKGRPFEKIWRGTEKLNVDFHLGRNVTELDPAAKRLHDNQGDEYGYEKLLLATGANPVHLPFGDEHIIYYRTLQDYQRLRAMAEQGGAELTVGREDLDQLMPSGRAVGEEPDLIEVGGFALMYPADPAAPSSETANCRCSIVASTLPTITP